jgi:thioredoxin 1
MVKIELFSAPGCEKCEAAQNGLQDIAASVFGADKMIWRNVDVLEELDYAVSLGVMTLPAIAINGKLVLSSLPNAKQMRDILEGLRP